MKKHLMLSFFLLLPAAFIFAQNSNCSFIKSISIKEDVYYEGAHGIKIDYSYDFDSLKNAMKNDSLFDESVFKLSIRLSDSSGNLKGTQQYKVFKNAKKEIEYNYTLDRKDFSFKEMKTCFIPYAALEIPAGKNTIYTSVALTGKDGNGNKYSQYFSKQVSDIHKKKQWKLTFNIDYIEADKLDTKNNVWDFSPFGYNTAPDVAASFLVGGNSIWKLSVENTTVFAVGPKSKNIIFKISDGDEVYINVTDADIMFDDYIGSIKIKPTAADVGKLHVIEKGSGKIIGCNLNWKME